MVDNIQKVVLKLLVKQHVNVLSLKVISIITHSILFNWPLIVSQIVALYVYSVLCNGLNRQFAKQNQFSS